MLEKPDLPDERISATLHNDFGLRVSEITFLPLGADVNTAVYRAVSPDGTSYFVKLRSGFFDTATVLIPRRLSDLGITQIIPPISTRSGQLWTHLDAYNVMLSPFVNGESGFDRHLSDDQWVSLGTALKGIHSAQLPPDLTNSLPLEAYDPRWRESVRGYQARVENESFNDPSAAKLAEIMQANRDTISKVVERAGQLAAELRSCSPRPVLCHGDIHAGNVLISDDNAMYIVDWDTMCMAPKERDLMFIGAGIGLIWNSPREEDLFYRGYGQTAVDPIALAYYRYERIVQDIAAFCEQLLDAEEGGDDREQSLSYFDSQFLPDSVIEIAFRSDPHFRHE